LTRRVSERNTQTDGEGEDREDSDSARSRRTALFTTPPSKHVTPQQTLSTPPSLTSKNSYPIYPGCPSILSLSSDSFHDVFGKSIDYFEYGQSDGDGPSYFVDTFDDINPFFTSQIQNNSSQMAKNLAINPYSENSSHRTRSLSLSPRDSLCTPTPQLMSSDVPRQTQDIPMVFLTPQPSRPIPTSSPSPSLSGAMPNDVNAHTQDTYSPFALSPYSPYSHSPAPHHSPLYSITSSPNTLGPSNIPIATQQSLSGNPLHLSSFPQNSQSLHSNALRNSCEVDEAQVIVSQ
jgi:hypothetical protein